jgi:hypothetical protein
VRGPVLIPRGHSVRGIPAGIEEDAGCSCAIRRRPRRYARLTTYPATRYYGDSALNKLLLRRVALTGLEAALARGKRPLGEPLQPRKERLVAELAADALGVAQPRRLSDSRR